jgi:hypothetical protein
MKNIHVLPTDKPSQIYKEDDGILQKDFVLQSYGGVDHYHIYITSDEEIKEVDWYLDEDGFIAKCVDAEFIKSRQEIDKLKKIIITDNKDLIKDGVQKIENEFLEWFVKNSNCEFVEVNKTERCINCGQEYCDNLQCRGFEDINYYKIIIPQEEPKTLTKLEIAKNIAAIGIGKEEHKQKKIEEAAEKHAKQQYGNSCGAKEERKTCKEDFIAGAKSDAAKDYWFEQFKKK